MQMNKSEVRGKLFDVFPIELPKQLETLDGYGEDISEVSGFYGVSWPLVSPKHFRDSFQVFCLFSPCATVYYIPALIKTSLEDLDATELAIGSFVLLIARLGGIPRISEKEYISSDCLDHIDSCFREVSTDQWSIILEWLHYLQVEHSEPDYWDGIQVAETYIRSRLE